MELNMEKEATDFYTSDKAYTSQIEDLIIGNLSTQATLKFTTVPDQNRMGKVFVWAALTANFNIEPIYSQDIELSEGEAFLSTDFINFNRGAYTVAIAIADDIHTIVSTVSVLNGQSVLIGSSAILVTGKEATHITAIYVNPTNITGIKESDWAFLYEGTTLSKGSPIAQGIVQRDEATGIVNIQIEPGQLKNGSMYNVCMSVGQSSLYVSSAYVFKYLVI
jgi:hypothetical protein